MKIYKFILLWIAFIPSMIMAQSVKDSLEYRTIFNELTGIRKKTDRFNLFLNMHGAFNAKSQDGFQEGFFEMKQLRIEIKGNINDWLSYRYRQRLNRGNVGNGNIDNLPTSIDVVGIDVKLSRKISLFLGKQCAAYGGIEFDLNPIEVYEYSDMIEYMNNFMTGINILFYPMEKQQIQFQILNSRNEPLEEMYGESEHIQTTKLPLVYTLNWNGNFNDVYKSRWSASVMNEVKGRRLYYYAIGNELLLNKFGIYFDWMYSREGIDRKGIMTSIVGVNNGHNVYNAEYMSFVLHGNYRFLPKWNVFVKGMYEMSSIYKTSENIEKGKYRTSWGYLGGVEFYPMDTNLHFFLTYIGRSYCFTEKAKFLGWENYQTNLLSMGFIWQLPLF